MDAAEVARRYDAAADEIELLRDDIQELCLEREASISDTEGILYDVFFFLDEQPDRPELVDYRSIDAVRNLEIKQKSLTELQEDQFNSGQKLWASESSFVGSCIQTC